MLIPCSNAFDELRNKLPIEHMERSSTAFFLEGWKVGAWIRGNMAWK
jgi:hypothetical protein